MKTIIEWCVAEYVNGVLASVISGCGRNKGTWGAACKSKATAQKWRRELLAKNPGKDYRVETLN